MCALAASGPEFTLKVTNPIRIGQIQSVDFFDNGSGGGWSSDPDPMPEGNSTVRFRVPTGNGQFFLAYYDGRAWRQDRLWSPTMTVTNGSAYVWDMAANTVRPETAATAPGTGTTPVTPNLGTFDFNRLANWAKANPAPAAIIGFVSYRLFFGKKGLF